MGLDESKENCCLDDLNFSLGISKVWGLVAQVDSLTYFLLRRLEDVGLFSIELSKLKPT